MAPPSYIPMPIVVQVEVHADEGPDTDKVPDKATQQRKRPKPKATGMVSAYGFHSIVSIFFILLYICHMSLSLTCSSIRVH